MASKALSEAESPIQKPIFGDTLGKEFVNLIVGPTRKEFTVHKKLICDSCDYFRRAFSSSFLEGVEGKIYLVEDSVDAVDLFVQWLYRREISNEKTHAQFNTLIKLYLMSEKWCFYELGNIAISVIQEYFWISEYKPSYVNHLLPDVVSYIWSLTEDNSPLRKLCIQRLAWVYCDEKKFNIIPGSDGLEQLWIACKDHSSFFNDFFEYHQKFKMKSRPPNPGSRVQLRLYGHQYTYAVKPCKFHRHNKGEKCKSATEPLKDQKQNDEAKSHDFFSEFVAIDLTE
ncbi:hypothetical protein NHQ30_010627 [Ciborinia camelliae]|nr:hypothetical protein NHQ30_010627 [Ciborinia camelliae]